MELSGHTDGLCHNKPVLYHVFLLVADFHDSLGRVSDFYDYGQVEGELKTSKLLTSFSWPKPMRPLYTVHPGTLFA